MAVSWPLVGRFPPPGSGWDKDVGMAPVPTTLAAALEQIRSQPLNHAPGFPPLLWGSSIAEIAEHRPQLRDFATPLAALSDRALGNNIKRMGAWCVERGVELQPHGKTTMSPQLFARQFEGGVTAITAATGPQVRTMRQFGVPAIHLANQLVDPVMAAWVAQEMSWNLGFKFWCWIDSVEGVRILEKAGAAAGTVFTTYLEWGVPGGRSGVRTEEEARAVRAAVRRSTHVDMVGVAGYEGVVASDRSRDSLEAVALYLRKLRCVADRLASDGAFAGEPPRLSAGGSMFYDLVAEHLTGGSGHCKPVVVLRSGCYVAHDHGIYRANSPLSGPGLDYPLEGALTVWGTVHSRPEPTRVLCDVGRRDVSTDQGLPVTLRVQPASDGIISFLPSLTVSQVNDQHAFLDLPDGFDLSIGDRVEFGVSHPCTTFDKWHLIPVVDDEGTVTDVVRTFF